MNKKCISIHSSRGGTGKSLLATNLAVLYAKKGLNVALLDLDFRAPSLEGIFSKAIPNPVDCWLNDYLNGRCSPQHALSCPCVQPFDGCLQERFANAFMGNVFDRLTHKSLD